MPSIAEVLKEATKRLQASGIGEPRREAASLLELALGKDKTFLIAYPEYELSEAESNRFFDFLARRAAREPFQQIAGKQEFYGLDFVVSPDVLIPRPETETIVETAIEILKKKDSPGFCEVGIGSGCISVSILHEVKDARGLGLDISEKALRLAAHNAERHRTAERLTLEISDVFAALRKKTLDLQSDSFDLIVSNPPYIPAAQVGDLQPEVRDFEPHTALTDGADGLSIIRKIIADAPDFLKPGGWLILEIGCGQAEAVRRMFAPSVWHDPEFIPDLQGILRTAKARKKLTANDV